MQWLNPAGAWAFSALAAILVLYMLRREYQETEISSTYLWRKALRDQTASRPFQKLRSSLLMLLQLLLAALLAFALMRPVAPGQAMGGETVMIFDVSASMQAREDGQTRLGEALNQARQLAGTMTGADRLTILTAGSQTRQLLSRSSDRQAALKALGEVRAENGNADLSGALSLALAMRREIKDLQIIVYSDSYEPPQGTELTYISVGSGADNRAIVSLSAAQREGKLTALTQVANYGAAASVSIACYADGQLCDARTLSMDEGAIKSISFDLPDGTGYVRAALGETDALAADDERHYILSKGQARRVALMGQDDIFLEKALAQRPDVVLVRTTPADAPLLDPCDLYIYDGVMPDTLPASGSLMVLNPTGEVLGVTPGAPKAPPYALRLAGNDLAAAFSDHVELKGVAIKQFAPLTGGQGVLLCGQEAAAAAGEADGKRFVVIGFDLHQSNWVLKYDFPIFMMHAFEYLMPDVFSGVKDAVCGSSVSLTLSSLALLAKVAAPSGRLIAVAPPFPPLPFSDTGEIGVYTLSQSFLDNKTDSARFAVNMPAGESDLRLTTSGSGTGGTRGDKAAYGLEWTIFLILALLAVSMLEWWVSVRAG